MALVKGVVEAQHDKWDKWNILVNGKWYNTKMEYAKVFPTEGQEVEFDDGGKNFTKNLRVVGGSTAVSPAPVSKGSYNFPKNRNLGVELGHAANLAKDMAIATPSLLPGSDEWYKFFITHTEKVYKVMAALRDKHEGGVAPVAKPAEPEEDDVVVFDTSKPAAEGEVLEATTAVLDDIF